MMRAYQYLVFFTNKIYLACRSYYIGQISKGKEYIRHSIVRQCHYCENYFAKTEENMKKYLEVCAAKEGITYSFDNGNIISFQDNFRYQEDLPFTVYLDFQTTTGDLVFFDPKM